ncbi:PAS domain S-box protein [bacterium]|nr:PAS domain S-box protein [bacterium]
MINHLEDLNQFLLKEDFIFPISNNIKKHLKNFISRSDIFIFIKYNDKYKIAVNKEKTESFLNIEQIEKKYDADKKSVFHITFMRDILIILKEKNGSKKKQSKIREKTIKKIVDWSIKDYLITSVGKIWQGVVPRSEYFILYNKFGEILYRSTEFMKNFENVNNFKDIFSHNLEKKYKINIFRKTNKKESMTKDALGHEFPATFFISHKKIHNVSVYFATFNDISEFYTIERSENRVYSLYNNILKSNIFGMLFFDKYKNIYFANDKLKKILNISDEKIINFNMENVENKQLHSILNKVLAGKSTSKAFFYKSYFRKLAKYLKVCGFPMKINNKVFGGALLVEDLTKGYDNKFFSDSILNIINKMSDGFIMTDKDGIIKYVNRAFCKMTGYSKNDLIGKNPKILKSGKHNKAFYKNFWQIIGSGKTFHGTFINKKKNGEIYHDLSTAKKMPSIGANEEYYYAIKRDITLEARQRAKEMNFEKFEALGKLSAGIAHDFNNILTGIYLNFKYLKKTEIFDNEIFDKIEDNIEMGKHIIEELLDYARKTEVKLKFVDLNLLIKKHIIFFEKLVGEKIKILVEIEKDLGCVKVNETKLFQVILNLLSNARDAIKTDGKITIRVKNINIKKNLEERKYRIRKGEYIKIEIEDTGNGIPDNILPQIFEPFFTTKKRSRGTGLGLATSYGIIKKMKGNIMVKTAVGKGTVFTIFLPYYERKNIKRKKNIPEKKTKRLSNDKIKILFIEDEKYIRDAMEKMLKHDNFNVEVAENGRIGLEKFHKGNFNVIITDLVMPEMNGDEVAEHIIKNHKNIKVILVTGYLEDDVKIKKNKNLFYMKKPYNYEKLKELIVKWKK